MKTDRFFRVFSDFAKQESSTHLAVGALLIVTILYAATMV